MGGEAMEWAACEEQVGTLGHREGHCAVCLPVPGTEETWVLCVGGYCDGGRDGSVIASDIALLPALRWSTIAHNTEWFECDGASLTRAGDTPAAYLFAGLDAEMELCRRLIRMTLRRGEDTPVLGAEELQTTGDVPSPRARHSAGATATHLFVFGGETDVAEQTNDAYLLNLGTLVWTCVKAGPSVPTPRLLAGPLVFLSPHVCVLYGGAHFMKGDIRSLSDVWCCDLSSGAEWTLLQGGGDGESSLFPRSNGHGAGLFRGKDGDSVLFLGGKDVAEGCDKVKQVRRCAASGREFFTRLVVPAASGGRCPHWRYTPAVAETPRGLLLLGGHCRHPQEVAAFLLRLATDVGGP